MVYCIRDFDEKGFEIARTLREDTRRYSWSGKGAIDLGLRLEDVERFNLESEPVYYGKRQIEDGLRKAGATEAEIAFLARRRVELNAFTSTSFSNGSRRSWSRAASRRSSRTRSGSPASPLPRLKRS